KSCARYLQIVADRRAEVGKRFARSQRTRRADSRTGDPQRNVPARVVRRYVRRIATVIRCDEQQIVRAKRLQQSAELRIERLQCFRVTRCVVAMPVLGIEIDEVRED